MSARDEILTRVRHAVADVTTAPGERRTPPLVETGPPGSAESCDLFVERVADYRATVVRTSTDGIPSAIADALTNLGARTVVVPDGLDPSWTTGLGTSIAVLAESEASSHEQLDAVDAVITAARVGIALTGTIVLDHDADQGRRELTLVPDIHVCVIGADQVVHDVPDAVLRLRPAAGGVRPLTWISGPSATSDIELNRVEGVHGPRNLVVVLVE
jgi:L-lactate dehydrogenase complex protein LldG